MQPEAPSQRDVALAGQLVAARRDQLPERSVLDEFERLAVGVYALRALGVEVRPVMRLLNKHTGTKYAAYVMEVGPVVLSMDGLKGWDAIVRDILQIKPGQRHTMEAEQDVEKFLFADMNPDARVVFDRAVDEDIAFLNALLLQQETALTPLLHKGARL